MFVFKAIKLILKIHLNTTLIFMITLTKQTPKAL